MILNIRTRASLLLQITEHRVSCSSTRDKHQFGSVQSLSHVWLFVTPWTATCQASLSNTNSRVSLKLMSIELVMPSKHLILCHPLLLLPSIFPSIRMSQFKWVSSSHQVAKVLQMSQFFTSGGQSIGVSASASVFPTNIHDWFFF